MRVQQWRRVLTDPAAPLSPDPAVDLVFVFGGPAQMLDPAAFDLVRAAYPAAHVVGASSSGEVLGDRVYDGSIVVSAVTFDRAVAAVAQVALRPGDDDHETGRRLAAALAPTHPTAGPLRHVFALADGVTLNGSGFARGLEAGLPSGVAVTGGLAADHAVFEQTPLWADGVLEGPGAVAVGLYGASLQVGYGAVGGWDPFGPERLVTKSEGNVLHELDGRSALALYKEYLGPHAADLPASGLLFPLAIRTRDGATDLVRSTIGTDDDAETITFAGDVPEGAYARFMKTNVERLIDGAASAAQAAADRVDGVTPALTVVVSCVGRRLAHPHRIEEELEEVGEVLGGGLMTGFYSHGELAPSEHGVRCELHNQTMTLTTFSEAA